MKLYSEYATSSKTVGYVRLGSEWLHFILMLQFV